MGQPLYKYHLPLKDLEAYVPLIKYYFGLSHPNLDLEIELVETGRDPERTFDLYEFVSYAEIGRAFDEFLVDHKDWYVSVLWLVGNLYFGDSIRQYEDYFMESVEDDLRWSIIEQEMLRLYLFMDNHKIDQPVTIKIGKEFVEIPNTDNWVQAILNNHVFPNCLPNIHDKTEAQALVWKKAAGAPLKRPGVNAVVNGVANLFFDKGLIKAKAPIGLLRFIKKYLVLMNLIPEGDAQVDEDWIKAQIHNFRKKSKDPRLNTREIRVINVEALKEIGSHPVEWAFRTE